MTSAGHIASHQLEWTNHLSESDATLYIAHPLQWLLPFGKASNVVRSGLERSAELRTDLLPRVIDFRLGNTERLSCQAIELLAVMQQSCVALLSHIADDFCSRLLNSRKIESTAIRDSLQYRRAALACNEFHSFVSLT